MVKYLTMYAPCTGKNHANGNSKPHVDTCMTQKFHKPVFNFMGIRASLIDEEKQKYGERTK